MNVSRATDENNYNSQNGYAALALAILSLASAITGETEAQPVINAGTLYN